MQDGYQQLVIGILISGISIFVLMSLFEIVWLAASRYLEIESSSSETDPNKHQ